MSSFAGIYHFDQRPAGREVIERIGKMLARKGPDGGNDYCDGPLAMTYRAFHTTRESEWELQPMEAASGEVLCWDGRLDNREDLQSQLDCPRQPSDAELVMAAYRKWGEEFLAYLVGDFALAIFDPQERQVLLGRDFFGPRPLYYLQRAEKLMWSTDLLPLMQHGGVDLALDDHYIAQFLVLSIESHRTPYRNIHAVEPGHVMIFRNGRLHKNTWYWKPDSQKEIRYKTDAEYEENLYALFRQSVKARLRSGRPVWADLSGGLDSSSIVCMADQILAQESPDCPRLDTWSAVVGDSIFTNELPYVRLVEEYRGRSGRVLREDEFWLRDIGASEAWQPAPNSLLCIPDRTKWLNFEMESAGARVRLSGHGGDHLLGNTNVGWEPADLARSLDFRGMHRQLTIWSRELQQPYTKLLAKHVLLPVLPGRLRGFWEINRTFRDSLAKNFVARFPRSTFTAYPNDPFGNSQPSRRERVRHLLAAIRLTSAGLYSDHARCEVRHPFLDRRLVEWLLAIPQFQLQRPGETRSLMRRAFKALLPPAIWNRQTKGSIDEVICRAFCRSEAEIEQLFVKGRLSKSGYFDLDYLKASVEAVAHGASRTRLVVIRLLALELWLSGLDGRGYTNRDMAAMPQDILNQISTAEG